MKNPHPKIWLPRMGEVDVRVWKVNQAVKEYDERLSVGRNEETGDWCVYIKMPPGSYVELYPVHGLGPEMPTDPQPILEHLWKIDAARHGTQLLRDLEKGQEKWRAEQIRKQLEPNIILADVMEFAMRRFGQTPYTKVFVNGATRKGYGEYY